MDELNRNIGIRLKQIREIFNEGSKLSVMQFAYLLDESRDKIANYESGRTSVTPKLIIELYRRGVNPVYLLTGEQSLFADNEAGRKFHQSLKSRNIQLKENGANLRIYRAAAGKIADRRDDK